MSSLSGVDEDTAQQRIGNTLASITNARNRATLSRYIEERRANGVRASTLANDANALRGLCDFLGKKALENVTKQDVVSYVNSATRERQWKSVRKDGRVSVTKKRVRLKASTLAIRKVIIRSFFQWLRGTEDYPPEVRSLKALRPRESEKPELQILTTEEVKQLLQAHPGAREKAALAVLYDSGLRAGEFCALNVGSVQFDEYGAVLLLPKGGRGLKTGARRVRLHESVPYLQSWFEAHPKKDKPKAPLFFSMSRRAPGARMTPNSLWEFVARAGETAGLSRHINPHLFRHSAATERARLGWTEGMMRAFFGWSRSSDMPAVYVHLAGLDYEKMDLERRGLLKDGEFGKRALQPLRCRVCSADNLPTNKFCHACRQPVSPEAEAELEERRQNEISEAASRLIAIQLKEQIAAEVERALAVASGKDASV